MKTENMLKSCTVDAPKEDYTKIMTDAIAGEKNIVKFAAPLTFTMYEYI